MKEYTYIDLFAGGGGFSEGFSKEHFKGIAHIEHDKHAANTLRTRIAYYYLLNTNQIDIYNSYLLGNIDHSALLSYVPKSSLESVINKSLSDETIDDIFDLIDAHLGNNKLDVLIGGPPCQPFSNAGKIGRNNPNYSDPRSKLYKYYIDFLIHFNPACFVFENVPGLITGKKFNEVKQDLFESFSEAGYNYYYQILNAKDFNVLQNRPRAIIIGLRKDIIQLEPNFDLKESTSKVNDLLIDLPKINASNEPLGLQDYLIPYESISNWLSENHIREKNDILTQHITINTKFPDVFVPFINELINNGRELKYNELPENLKIHGEKKGFQDCFKVVNPSASYSHAMTAHLYKDGYHFIHPDINQCRSLTVREAARIQSFPDNYYFEGQKSAAFKQIGNAIPPLMAAHIAKEIKNILNVNYRGGITT